MNNGDKRAHPSGVELSVVVPVYGCRGCLYGLNDRLLAAVSSITQDYEIVYVDDRSPDGSWETLIELVDRDPAVRAIRLSKNFGQQAAITAGLAHSTGRWTVVIDCDLEEPPEEIPRLYATAQEGYDIVLTKRVGRSHSPFRRAASHVYYRLRNWFLRTRTGWNHGTLSILSRDVVDAFLRLKDRDREYVVALDWLGYRSTTLEFQHAERPEGRSSYTLGKLFRLAFDGLFFQTTILLRWIVFIGFLVVLGGLALAAYYIGVYLFSEPPSGFTSLAVLLILIGGFIITSLGVIGLYVGRVFEQVKERPLFLVDQEAGGLGSLAEPEPATAAPDIGEQEVSRTP